MIRRPGMPLPGAFLALLSLFLLTMSAFAGEPEELFEKNRDAVLQNKFFVADEYVFATGKTVSRSTSGYDKARLFARESLTSYVQSFVDWPEAIDDPLRRMIWDEFAKTTAVEMNFQGATDVFKQKDGDRYTVVICVPKDKISTKKYSFETIRKTLLDPAAYQSGAIRISVCIELGDDAIAPDMFEAFAQKTEKEYGENVGRVIRGKNALSFRLCNEGDLSGKKASELLALLNESPYDPEICYYLGMKLKNDRFPKTANIFFNRGTVAAAFNPEFAGKCGKEITRQLPKKELLPFPETLFAPFKGNIAFDNDKLAFLNICPGLLPVGTEDEPSDRDYVAAKNSFSNNELEDAFAGFCASAAAKMTFSACNMAGNAGRRIEHKDESAALLLQASTISPSSPYPWVHLAWIYREKGLKDQMAYCVEKIKSLKQDKWTSGQLILLESEPQPAETETKQKTETKQETE